MKGFLSPSHAARAGVKNATDRLARSAGRQLNFRPDRSEADDEMRLWPLGLLLFLPAAIVTEGAQLRCPASRRIKPCACTTVNPSTGLVVVSCSNIRSWSLVKYALRPFRRRKAYQIVRLTIERIPNRATDARSLQRIFRWLTIGELIIRNAPFGASNKIPYR